MELMVESFSAVSRKSLFFEKFRKIRRMFLHQVKK